MAAPSHCWSQGGGAIADGPRATARGRRRQEAAERVHALECVPQEDGRPREPRGKPRGRRESPQTPQRGIADNKPPRLDGRGPPPPTWSPEAGVRAPTCALTAGMHLGSQGVSHNKEKGETVQHQRGNSPPRSSRRSAGRRHRPPELRCRAVTGSPAQQRRQQWQRSRSAASS